MKQTHIKIVLDQQDRISAAKDDRNLIRLVKENRTEPSLSKSKETVKLKDSIIIFSEEKIIEK